ncbi:MAG TPA: PVC-type heme-binding CxxCH protein, partial [Isosphaeraceae bacterium]|nr:PVC-type heme-binding CxxCH protein [Isosphaeraceae bacterium]
EMRGYPYPEDVPSGRVRRLEDRDGDGRYEHASTFLDGLSWPTSIVPYDGGVFVAVAPDILYARDDDGDGQADSKKVMFSGFGHENVQALVNGLLWGPDGWIYGAAGGNGGEIKNVSKPDAKPVNVRGRDFRFRPDGSAFEATSGGGQFGHTFDDWGHRFVCNNSNHIRQVVVPSRYLERNPKLAAPAPTVDIAVEGGAGPVFRISPPEPWRVVRTRQRAADPAFRKRAAPSELHASGFFTSATGVTIYRGHAYPSDFRGNAFVGDVGGNLVHRKYLRPNGPIFQAERADEGREFLASTDNWFRPVNFVNSPDGTLLILDMYRETIEHPWSIPEPIKMHLDLTSGHDRGRIYEVRPDGFARRTDRPAYSKANSLDLVKTLSDSDAWRRETAQRLLIERGQPDASVEKALHDLARDLDNPPLGRVHALWTLDVLRKLTPEDILPNVKAEEPGVREQVARLWETFLDADPENLGPLATLATDPDAMVRFQTALSLGDAGGPESLEALAKIAQQVASNRWMRVAILSGLAGRTGDFAEILARNKVFDRKETGPLLLDLGELIGSENQPEAVSAFVKRFAASGSGAKAAHVHDVLTSVGRGLARSGGSLRTLLNGPLADDLEPIFAQAAKTVDEPGPVAARIEAVKLIGLGPEDSALHVLPALLTPREPVVLQLAALQALAPINNPEVGIVIVEHWRSLGPSARREAAETLLAKPDRAQALLDAL